MNPDCQHLRLEQILVDQCDPGTESRIQEHLDQCEACQQRLSQLAADAQTWEIAAEHLSTVDMVALDRDLQDKLARSASFIVPQPHHAIHTESSEPELTVDWKSLLDPPRHPEMLGRIDEFEVDSRIGQGGMGIVLKGFDRKLNRAVAIKVLAPHLASNGTARRRFAREAQAAAAVVHPNVVPIYSVNQSPDRPYIVMQLVSGQSLQAAVEEQGPLSPKEIVRIGMQIADGLAAAHEQGLIHRDVKPANVLTERDVTRVMITDFGLARAVDDAGMTQTGWLAGTPHYMSPEQSRGDDLDARSDLFSLGSLLYFLATGREPFRAERSYGVIQKIIHESPMRPCHLNADIPPTLSTLIEKLLEKDPRHRFQSSAELSECLRQYLVHLQQPTQVKPPKGITTVSQRSRRQRIVAIAIPMAVLILAGIASQTDAVRSWWNAAPPAAGPAALPELTVPALDLAMDDESYQQEQRAIESDLARLEQLFGTTDPRRMIGGESAPMQPTQDGWRPAINEPLSGSTPPGTQRQPASLKPTTLPNPSLKGKPDDERD